MKSLQKWVLLVLASPLLVLANSVHPVFRSFEPSSLLGGSSLLHENLDPESSAASGNILDNGDFESGDGSLGGWSCSNCHCSVEQFQVPWNHYLAVTERSNIYGGPWQIIGSEHLTDEKNLQFAFNFTMASSTAALAEWKIRVTTEEGDVKYFLLTSDEFGEGWNAYFHFINLPRQVVGAREVKLYLEVTPDADFDLDDIVMQVVDAGDWESEANERIDRLRKRDVTIQVTIEGTDSPSELTLEVDQTDHLFPFGTAVKSDKIAACWDAKEDTPYCSFVRENFKWMVDSYRMKWRPSEPNQGQLETEVPDKMISWASEAGKTVRGHSLLWAKRSNNPDWVQDMFGEDFVQAVTDRVTFAVQHFDGQVPHWDVINEMVDEGAENHTFYLDHSGDPLIRSKMFKLAKSLSPETLFFVNDYGIILDKYNRFGLYQQQIRDLLAEGAPIDAIGVQAHIGGEDLVDVVRIKHHVDLLWEEFKLPIWVTEFDWNGNGNADWGDHSVHAEQLENFYRLMFSHEGVEGILMWRLDIIDEMSGEPNKAGLEFIRLTQEEWRSSQLISSKVLSSNKRDKVSDKVSSRSETSEVVSDKYEHRSTATFAFRGFMGDYRLRLLHGSESYGTFEMVVRDDVNLQCTLGQDQQLIC